MKKNIFFDMGNTLMYPRTNNWFVTPNFFKITEDIDKELLEKAIKKNVYILDERNIQTEDEEFDMFVDFYRAILNDIKHRSISEIMIRALAYECVYNDNKIKFYPDVKKNLAELSEEYNLYIITDAWPSTHRILKDYGIDKYFKRIFVSSELGYKKADKKLFEIALNGINRNDTNFFIDDRVDLLDISKEYGFIPIIIDRDKNQETSYIEIEKLADLKKVLKYFED